MIPVLGTLLADVDNATLATLPPGTRFETEGEVRVPEFATPDASGDRVGLSVVYMEKNDRFWRVTRWATAGGGLNAIRLVYGDRMKLVRLGVEPGGAVHD